MQQNQGWIWILCHNWNKGKRININKNDKSNLCKCEMRKRKNVTFVFNLHRFSNWHPSNKHAASGRTNHAAPSVNWKLEIENAYWSSSWLVFISWDYCPHTARPFVGNSSPQRGTTHRPWIKHIPQLAPLIAKHKNEQQTKTNWKRNSKSTQ